MPERKMPADSVMRGVIPYLSMAGRSAEAADFYIKAFAAKDLGRVADDSMPGKHLHIQLEINGGALMMTDCSDHKMADTPLSGAHLQIVSRDGGEWWERALAAGCREVMAYGPQPWGDDWGLFVDPFNVHWAILTPGEN